MLKAGFVLGGKYEILSVIGKGGTSIVYLALHQKLHQKWAVKEIDREYCENYGMISRQLIAEADILKDLDHPGLPKIIDIIEKNNTIWLIMEFIEGKTLKEILKEQGKIEEGQVIDWGKQLCEVLYYLHTRKPAVIYRDIKPSNIMIKKTGKLVLIDFGTAREYSNLKAKEDTTYLGTRGYAAPEQYGGLGQTDCRTDIYGLGMTFYHLLTGNNPEREFHRIYSSCSLDEWGNDVSEGMRQIILKCIQYDPENRYQDCKALSEALLQAENDGYKRERSQRKRTKFFTVAAVCVFLSGLIFCTAFEYVGYHYREKKALSYVSRAEKSIDKTTMENNYRKALQAAPDSMKVYDSMLTCYIKPENFKIEDAVVLVNLLTMDIEGSDALAALKRRKVKEYGEVCYEVGLGCFYDISGTTGKKMAESWFADVEALGDKEFDKNKIKRAGLYADICNYYRTFLTNGEDRSGERGQKDFYDFYKTLHSLNEIQITRQSADSDISAAWLISKETTIELVNYGEIFLEHEKITESMLDKELQRIRERMELFKERKSKEEIEELECLIEDAERKVGTLSKTIYEGEEGIAD